MAELKFQMVTAMPGGALPPHTLFFVNSGGSYAETYLTSEMGVAKAVGNTAMIEAVVGAMTAASEVQLVADITARDALDLDINTMVLVTDATGDPTVEAGAAMYFYDATSETFIKVTEYESLDVTLNWAALADKPTSSVELIDQAVAWMHQHSNLSVLEQFTDDGVTGLLYQGVPIDTKTVEMIAADW
jgi:hypothetical protein